MMIIGRAMPVVRTLRARRRAGAAVEVALAVALALGVPASAAAQPQRGDERSVRGELSAGFMHFDYEENANGVFLDGETGFVPSVRGALEVRRSVLFMRFSARLAGGDVDYDGHVQGDPVVDGLPIQSTSDARFLQGEAQVGGFVDHARRVVVFGALGWRRWDRDINGTTVVGRDGLTYAVSGLSETYSWYELQGGIRWTFLATPRTEWDVDARVVRVTSPEISIDLGQELTLDLEPTVGFRGGASFRYLLAHDRFLSVAVEAESYAFGRSDLVEIPGTGIFILEPDSDTQNVSLLVGFGGRF
jgi:hypothetical protein